MTTSTSRRTPGGIPKPTVDKIREFMLTLAPEAPSVVVEMGADKHTDGSVRYKGGPGSLLTNIYVPKVTTHNFIGKNGEEPKRVAVIVVNLDE